MSAICPYAPPAATLPGFLRERLAVHPAMSPVWLYQMAAGRGAPLPVLRAVAATCHAHGQGLQRAVPRAAARLCNPEHRQWLCDGASALLLPAAGELTPARRLGRLCNTLGIDAGEDARGRVVVERWWQVIDGAASGAAAIGALAGGCEGLAALLGRRVPSLLAGVAPQLPPRVQRAMALLAGAGDDPCRRALWAVAARLCALPGLLLELQSGFDLALALQHDAWQRLHRRSRRSWRAA
jgi:hypothetical protein